MKKLIPFLISGVLVAGVFGCQEAPKSSSENPTTTNESAQAPAKEASQTTETAAKTATEKTKPADTTAATEKTKIADTTAAKTATEKTKPADTTAATEKTKIADTTAAKTATEKTKPVVTAGSDNVKSLALGKLKDKLPGSNLVVEDKQGVVTVTGTVPTEADLKKIEPIVKQLNGVKSVKVEAKVATEKKP
ncbi:putative phospholipid-binding protein [Cylindrospermum stagnale PCC 7417]|uniref:Putative phospholipid-binding protein n=1 Tax=Cylindrospermum stagnale PCC 7417 TaxID=56107 RepID=K9WYE3_9NOST|nr:BON domain-containing protein [Cylindrospermum stagnale]AFZ25390.1 putative phospholipid-binding protein [Cylindrospermum stagnale PCC 7417]